MKINDLVKETGEINRDKGWRDTKRSDLELLALIHSEISEAVEEVRFGDRPPIWQKGDSQYANTIVLPDEQIWSNNRKPEGVAIELADAVIRIADFFDYHGWDLEQALRLKLDYNKTRSYRHGGKKY